MEFAACACGCGTVDHRVLHVTGSGMPCTKRMIGKPYHAPVSNFAALFTSKQPVGRSVVHEGSNPARTAQRKLAVALRSPQAYRSVGRAGETLPLISRKHNHFLNGATPSQMMDRQSEMTPVPHGDRCDPQQCVLRSVTGSEQARNSDFGHTDLCQSATTPVVSPVTMTAPLINTHRTASACSSVNRQRVAFPARHHAFTRPLLPIVSRKSAPSETKCRIRSS
jgi:hypothetical protein